MENKPKPDDRRDNVRKIQYNIDRLLHNMEASEEMIQKIDHENIKKELIEKNERRRKALEGLREEIRDEAYHMKKEES